MNMETKKFENNQVTISGEIVSDFRFSHEVYGEGFYLAYLAVNRLSREKDVIPVIVSERLADTKTDWTGRFVRISGQFRSRNQHENGKSRLTLFVFSREFEVWEDDGTERPADENSISLDGYICKQPVYRETPSGREIADIFLAVNRSYSKSDYIPCICWGRNARYAENLKVGMKLKIWGRIQSREYYKKISEDEVETRVAYEVSIQKIELWTEQDGTKEMEGAYEV